MVVLQRSMRLFGWLPTLVVGQFVVYRFLKATSIFMRGCAHCSPSSTALPSTRPGDDSTFPNSLLISMLPVGHVSLFLGWATRVVCQTHASLSSLTSCMPFLDRVACSRSVHCSRTLEDFESVFEKKLAPIAHQSDYQYVTIVLNSNIWVPQNRARFYALLIATPFIPRGFDLASLIPTAPVVCPMQSFRSWIRSVSLRWRTIADVRSQHRTSTVFARNLQYVLTTGAEKVKRSLTRPAFVFCDMHTSHSRVACSLDQIPCVTRTRGEQGRFWVFEAPHQTFVRCAQLDCKALGSLQGWSSTGITTMLGSISNRQLCAAFGNGMTLPVLVEFVSRVMTMFATMR